MQRNDLLVWVDLEMTSLVDVRTDRITEIAVILTDKDLNVIAEGPEIVIHVDDALFDRDRVPASARAIYGDNGLRKLSAESTISLEEAEQKVLAFLQEHVAEKTAPLCGNTIHMDRHFLRIHMPRVDEYLFYRCIDVSSIKELARRWAPPIYEEAERRKGEKPHRAKGDILNSIEELRFYRDTFFKL